MSSFTEPLWIEPAGNLWRTCRAFSYEIGKKGSGLKIEVPSGTVTDLGTIPRALWPILPPHDPRSAAAFVLHDMLCRDHAFSRFVADCVFYEALRVLDVPVWRALILFSGARLGGLISR